MTQGIYVYRDWPNTHCLWYYKTKLKSEEALKRILGPKGFQKLLEGKRVKTLRFYESRTVDSIGPRHDSHILKYKMTKLQPGGKRNDVASIQGSAAGRDSRGRSRGAVGRGTGRAQVRVRPSPPAARES